MGKWDRSKLSVIYVLEREDIRTAYIGTSVHVDGRLYKHVRGDAAGTAHAMWTDRAPVLHIVEEDVLWSDRHWKEAQWHAAYREFGWIVTSTDVYEALSRSGHARAEALGEEGRSDAARRANATWRERDPDGYVQHMREMSEAAGNAGALARNAKYTHDELSAQVKAGLPVDHGIRQGTTTMAQVWVCNDCGLQSTCMGVARHLKFSGHSGRTRIA